MGILKFVNESRNGKKSIEDDLIGESEKVLDYYKKQLTSIIKDNGIDSERFVQHWFNLLLGATIHKENSKVLKYSEVKSSEYKSEQLKNLYHDNGNQIKLIAKYSKEANLNLKKDGVISDSFIYSMFCLRGALLSLKDKDIIVYAKNKTKTYNDELSSSNIVESAYLTEKKFEKITHDGCIFVSNGNEVQARDLNTSEVVPTLTNNQFDKIKKDTSYVVLNGKTFDDIFNMFFEELNENKKTESLYNVGQKVFYIPKISGMNQKKGLIIDDKVWKKEDSLLGEKNEFMWWYSFKDSHLSAREHELSDVYDQNAKVVEAKSNNYNRQFKKVYNLMKKNNSLFSSWKEVEDSKPNVDATETYLIFFKSLFDELCMDINFGELKKLNPITKYKESSLSDNSKKLLRLGMMQVDDYDFISNISKCVEWDANILIDVMNTFIKGEGFISITLKHNLDMFENNETLFSLSQKEVTLDKLIELEKHKDVKGVSQLLSKKQAKLGFKTFVINLKDKSKRPIYVYLDDSVDISEKHYFELNEAKKLTVDVEYYTSRNERYETTITGDDIDDIIKKTKEIEGSSHRYVLYTTDKISKHILTMHKKDGYKVVKGDSYDDFISESLNEAKTITDKQYIDFFNKKAIQWYKDAKKDYSIKGNATASIKDDKFIVHCEENGTKAPKWDMFYDNLNQEALSYYFDCWSEDDYKDNLSEARLCESEYEDEDVVVEWINNFKNIVKDKRNKINKLFPTKDGWKFSIRQRDGQSLYMNILSAPYDLLENVVASRYIPQKYLEYTDDNIGRTYPKQEFGVYSTDLLKGKDKFMGKALKSLSTIFEIMNDVNYDNSDSQSDYFDFGYVLTIKIGSYEKGFKVPKKYINENILEGLDKKDIMNRLHKGRVKVKHPSGRVLGVELNDDLEYVDYYTNFNGKKSSVEEPIDDFIKSCISGKLIILESKNFDESFKYSKDEELAKVISSKTGLRASAILTFGINNELDLFDLMQKVSSNVIKTMDLTTAISGKTNNSYAKSVVNQVKKVNESNGKSDSKLDVYNYIGASSEKEAIETANKTDWSKKETTLSFSTLSKMKNVNFFKNVNDIDIYVDTNYSSGKRFFFAKSNTEINENKIDTSKYVEFFIIEKNDQSKMWMVFSNCEQIIKMFKYDSKRDAIKKAKELNDLYNKEVKKSNMELTWRNGTKGFNDSIVDTEFYKSLSKGKSGKFGKIKLVVKGDLYSVYLGSKLYSEISFKDNIANIYFDSKSIENMSDILFKFLNDKKPKVKAVFN